MAKKIPIKPIRIHDSELTDKQRKCLEMYIKTDNKLKSYISYYNVKGRDAIDKSEKFFENPKIIYALDQYRKEHDFLGSVDFVFAEADVRLLEEYIGFGMPIIRAVEAVGLCPRKHNRYYSDGRALNDFVTESDETVDPKVSYYRRIKRARAVGEAKLLRSLSYVVDDREVRDTREEIDKDASGSITKKRNITNKKWIKGSENAAMWLLARTRPETYNGEVKDDKDASERAKEIAETFRNIITNSFTAKPEDPDADVDDDTDDGIDYDIVEIDEEIDGEN